MLSRVASLVYWMARQLERAENAARILDVNTQLALDIQTADGDDPRAWEPIINVVGQRTLYEKLYSDISERDVADFIIFNRKNPSSIASSVAAARENARCVREQLSSEAWEQINRLYLRLKNDSFEVYQQLGSNEFLNRTKLSLQLFSGIASSMFPRGETWHFYELGQFLERADNTSRLMDVKYFTILPSVEDIGTAIDSIQWAAVLRSCSAFEAFRKNRRGQITADRVSEYLILERVFPRSIRYSIIRAEKSIRRITSDAEHHSSNAPSRALGRLRADLDYTNIEDIVGTGLHEWIDKLQVKISEVDGEIEKTFFSYEPATAPILY